MGICLGREIFRWLDHLSHSNYEWKQEKHLLDRSLSLFGPRVSPHTVFHWHCELFTTHSFLKCIIVNWCIWSAPPSQRGLVFGLSPWYESFNLVRLPVACRRSGVRPWRSGVATTIGTFFGNYRDGKLLGKFKSDIVSSSWNISRYVNIGISGYMKKH